MTGTPLDIDRLPNPGAGFVWELYRHGVGPYPVLRAEGRGVEAVFTTRVGGVSLPPLDELNLSLSRGDHPARVFCNRDLATRPISGDWNWCTVRQVHGERVVYASRSGRRDADALWTDDPAHTLAVLVADCVPLLLVGERGIAVVHAGWRGLAAGVVEAACAEIAATAGWAGPAIGPCCFEVGDDVSIPFVERFGKDVMADGRHADLWTATERAARAGGCDVKSARLCTSCQHELFFSHRRDDGLTGRQALVARIAP